MCLPNLFLANGLFLNILQYANTIFGKYSRIPYIKGKEITSWQTKYVIYVIKKHKCCVQ